jgi:hypothetical protein
MSSARTLIATQTLGSTNSTIAFSSIPSTYDDLLIIFSLRSNRAAGLDSLLLKFNNSTSSYTFQHLIGFVNNTSGYVEGGGGGVYSYGAIGDTETAGLFSSGSVYVANYSKSKTKNLSYEWGSFWVGMTTGRWNVTDTINSFAFTVTLGTAFLAGSTVSLYGITNGTSGSTTIS